MSTSKPVSWNPSPHNAPQARAPCNDAFERHLSELQSLQLLDARREIELARETEALMIRHGCDLLSRERIRQIQEDALV